MQIAITVFCWLGALFFLIFGIYFFYNKGALYMDNVAEEKRRKISKEKLTRGFCSFLFLDAAVLVVIAITNFIPLIILALIISIGLIVMINNAERFFKK